MIRQQMGTRVVSAGQSAGRKVVVPTAPAKPGKLMRLRCRLRPLHDLCFSSDGIADKECDVTFSCEGGEVRAHKIILAMASKFFTQLFRDQKPHKQSYVSVPDIPVGSMRLIILLCYKDRVSLGMKTMKDLGNYLSVFGLSWDQFNFSEATASEQASTSRKSVPASIPISNNRVGIISRQSLQFQQPSKGQFTVKPSSNYGQANLKNFSQTFILDTNEPNEGLHSYDQQSGHEILGTKPLTKPRLILPKPPSGNTGAVIYRTVQTGPPVLQRMSNVSTIQMVPSQVHNIEMDETADPEDTEPANTPEAHQLMQEWVDSLGKSAGSPPKLSRSGPSPTKRSSISPVGSPNRGIKGVERATKSAKMQCSVCNNIFDDESKWRWHEERHVGLSLFKCTICDQILPTARKVYQHEMMEHGIVASGSTDEGSNNVTVVKGQPKLIGHVPVGGDEKTRVAMVRTQYGTHYRRIGTTASAAAKSTVVKKYKSAATAKLHQNFAHRNPRIEIGHAEGQELVESRKLKQLHWLYVCANCETCSDSSTKAMAHYSECYPNGEKEFEESVLKFRQGFYGRCKCPLCPRRYTSLSGFLIHCGHMHSGYRKKFSHINTEDKIMCVSCRGKFLLPDGFHAHLNKDQVCDEHLREDSVDHGSDHQGQEMSSTSANQTFEESRQKQYTKLLGTNPRSARLQNRLAAVTACYEDDSVDEETLPPVACPICGTAEIKNLTAHLNELHPEIDVKVERFEVSTLRCKACSITFATCDLLAHNNSCTGSKGLNYVAQRKAAATKSPHEPPKPKEPFEYPEGIGCSPIETMDHPDLTSADYLRAQLRCPVCKRNGKKMNVIADCLKNHGVYRCAICFNTYMSKESNSQHLKKCHGNSSGKLICPICNVPRANAGQLVSHMYGAHWQALLLGGAQAQAAPEAYSKEEGNETDKLEMDKEEGGLNSSGGELEASGGESKDNESIKNEDYADLTLKELLKTSDPAPPSEKED